LANNWALSKSGSGRPWGPGPNMREQRIENHVSAASRSALRQSLSAGFGIHHRSPPRTAGSGTADERHRRLTDAKLMGAKLMGAKLMGARLMGARLMGARLMGERLIGRSLTGRYGGRAARRRTDRPVPRCTKVPRAGSRWCRSRRARAGCARCPASRNGRPGILSTRPIRRRRRAAALFCSRAGRGRTSRLCLAGA
jgi:uncharacterized protein YjbI with pentapeptide repeats